MKYLFDGKTMKEARLERELRQIDMAEELGIVQRQYIRWEHGEVTLKPYQLDKIAELLGAEVYEQASIPVAAEGSEPELQVGPLGSGI